MERKFNRTATAEIIRLLKEQLKEYRGDLDSTYLRDIEEKIKSAKERITALGIAGSQSKTCDCHATLDFIKSEREKADKDLEFWRGQFKTHSKGMHDSKEMIRHLEHAITTLKKEFAQ